MATEVLGVSAVRFIRMVIHIVGVILISKNRSKTATASGRA